MKIGKLDHVNIRTTQLDIMMDWYTSVLGLRAGHRPNFPFPGIWLYAGDAAVVHLVGIEGPPAVGSEVELKLEHFAFSASGRSNFEAELQAMGAQYRTAEIPAFNLVQINIWDPDGNRIHIDFAVDEEQQHTELQ